jgi:hypothetical protein
LLKITDYADRLEEGLEGLDWPSGTMAAQKQWIGKSIGSNIDFQVEGFDTEVRTTRKCIVLVSLFAFHYHVIDLFLSYTFDHVYNSIETNIRKFLCLQRVLIL